MEWMTVNKVCGRTKFLSSTLDVNSTHISGNSLEFFKKSHISNFMDGRSIYLQYFGRVKFPCSGSLNI